MSSILDMLESHLNDDRVKALSNKLGADETQTRSAMGAAIPALINMFARHAQTDEGVSKLTQAMQKHDDSVFDRMEAPAQGDSMLNDIFGDKRNRVQQGIGSLSGLDVSKAGSLLSMLAPMVLGAMRKTQGQQKIDAGSLSSWLQKENGSMAQKSPQGTSFLGKMLDQDGDGDFDISDALKLGMGLLFGRK